MPRTKRDAGDQATEVLQKLLVLQMYTLGATQDRIAKAVGKQKAWVNDLLKGLPRGGKQDGSQAKAKKVQR